MPQGVMECQEKNVQKSFKFKVIVAKNPILYMFPKVIGSRFWVQGSKVGIC
jgi:hypothetical protein